MEVKSVSETKTYTVSSSLVMYGGGSKLSTLAKRSPRPGGGSATVESRTESGIATRASSKNDLIVYIVQKFYQYWSN